MNLNSFACLFIVCCIGLSCNSQENKKVNQGKQGVKEGVAAIDIDNIYFSLSGNRSFDFKEILGQFVYQERNADKGEYLATFISESLGQSVKYASYSGDKNDILSLGNTRLALKAKIDPLSIRIYSLLFTESQYLIFVGKAQSASGSGVQVTYFNMIKLNEKGNAESHCEFESRFGDINSIGDYNKDGVLDYFKIINGKNVDEYRLTVNDVQSSTQISDGYVLLKYKLNDKFVLLQDSLLRK